MGNSVNKLPKSPVEHKRGEKIATPMVDTQTMGLGLVPPTHPHRSPSEGDIPNMGLRLETPQYMRMGCLIKKLAEFVGPRNNVHKDIKKMVANIQTVYDRLGVELHTVSNETQTSPTAQRSYAQVSGTPDKVQGIQDGSNMKKRKASSPLNNQLRKVKQAQRRKNTVPMTPPRTENSRGEISGSNTRRVEIPPQATPDPERERQKPAGRPAVTVRDGEQWQLVGRREKKKKKKPPAKARRKPPPPNVLVVHKAQDETTYASIIQKVKSDPALKDIGEKVEKLRRTAGGKLLIMFAKTEEKEMETYRATIRETLKDEATVEMMIPESEIEVRDLDEWATKEEVVKLLKDHIPELKELTPKAVKSLRKSWASTQIAVVSLPTVHARKVATLGKIRAGWGTVRIREKVSPSRCFKCWHFGHKALDCRKKVDRSKTCFKCGQDGHKATTCKEPPKCILCREKDPQSDCSHTAGGWRCPIFQNARRAVMSAENESAPT